MRNFCFICQQTAKSIVHFISVQSIKLFAQVCYTHTHTFTHNCSYFNAKAFSFCKQIFLSFNSGGHCL